MKDDEFDRTLKQMFQADELMDALKKHTWHADQHFGYSVLKEKMVVHAFQPLDLRGNSSFNELQETAFLWMSEIAEVLMGDVDSKNYFIKVLYFDRREYMAGQGFRYFCHVQRGRKLGPVDTRRYRVSAEDRPFIHSKQIALLSQVPLANRYFLFPYFDGFSLQSFNAKESCTLGVFRIVDNKKIDQSERVRKAFVKDLSMYICDDGPYRKIVIQYIDRFWGKFGGQYSYDVKAWGNP